MPRLSCWFIRSALLHLLLGFTWGGLLLLHKGIFLHPFLWLLLPAHIEFLLIGWTTQLMMGVSFWIFPRFWQSRGNEKMAWLAFGLLNSGIWLVGLGSFWNDLPLISFLGRITETGAALAFACHVWSRIKPAGANEWT